MLAPRKSQPCPSPAPCINSISVITISRLMVNIRKPEYFEEISQGSGRIANVDPDVVLSTFIAMTSQSATASSSGTVSTTKISLGEGEY